MKVLVKTPVIQGAVRGLSGVVALLGLVASLPAMADPAAHRATLEALVSCKASLAQVLAFNEAVRAPGFDLPVDEEHAPWGGLAWRVKSPVALGGVSSDVLLMETNRSFYLRVATKDPQSGIVAAAKALQLEVVSEGNYQRALGDRTLQAQATGEPDNYWLGCFYDEEALTKAK